MKITKLFVLSGLLISCNIIAQEDPFLGLFMQNKQLFNPAYISDGEENTFGLDFRKYRYRYSTDLEGATPLSFLAYVNSYSNKFKSGFGAIIFSDHYDMSKSFEAGLSYSCKIKLKDDINFNIGTRFSIIRKEDYAYFLNYQKKPNVDFGIWLNNPDYYIGLSVRHLFEPEFNINSFSKKLKRHYYVTIGGKIGLLEKIYFSPSFVIKSYGTRSQFEINNTFIFNEILHLGAGYRGGDAVIVNAGTSFRYTDIFFSLDIVNSEYETNECRNYEITFRYRF